MEIMEPSTSDFNTPVVLVKKKEGTHRFCIDFKKLNSITKFDPERLAKIDDRMTLIS